ncbi:hypothetical protein [Methylobacterium sp. A54F]
MSVTTPLRTTAAPDPADAPADGDPLVALGEGVGPIDRDDAVL